MWSRWPGFLFCFLAYVLIEVFSAGRQLKDDTEPVEIAAFRRGPVLYRYRTAHRYKLPALPGVQDIIGGREHVYDG